ncbi:DUF4097 family beta strand repeat-containing protein [Hyalangium versicolor]|uniref:DUF4097 family beta strand repeat-containing protein n=1 Tax=Hyalangium versicolor TaxID=2861190 RepID=UPI001CCF5E4F|nr:DUF4097 family beta strand repeat-containing protein [Hyalangium versicolor]
MQRSLSWVGLLALACGGCAHYEVRDAFEQSFEQTVEGPVTRVEVESSSGDVRIQGVPGAPVKVKGRISVYAGSQAKAREVAEQIARTPPVERSGQVVSVGKHVDTGGHLFGGVSIDYEVVVPPELSAFVNSSSGDVEVSGLQGEVKVDSSSGEVKLRQVGSAKVSSSSGNVVLEGVAGDIEVDSSSGDVDVRATPGPKARWDIEASSGDVTLTVAPDAAFQLDASTSSGNVKSEIPIRIRGTVDEDELHGKVGDRPSEAEVKLGTSSGDIRIREEGRGSPQASN